MISFSQAFEIVIGNARRLPVERVPIQEAYGRILAEDVCSDIEMPPFDKSAMDGFACRRDDLEQDLVVLETIGAGASPTHKIEPGTCSRIMTGAPVPEGADCVIMQEYVEQVDQGRIRFTGNNTKSNICKRGEDINAGDCVISKGIRLHAQHIAVLATAGCYQPLVSVKPRVGVIATGDELVEPDSVPGASQIRNSNSYQISSHALSSDAIVSYYGIAKDDEESIDILFKKAVAENDVVLLSGGVSTGDFDFVPAVMTRNGFDIKVNAIALKPGKPTHFAISGSKFCFGLPGNPVSTYIQFEILVKPFLYALMGHEYKPLFSSLPMANTYHRKKVDREAWIPVRINNNNQVETIDYHGSAHINALVYADGFILLPVGEGQIQTGEQVIVRHI